MNTRLDLELIRQTETLAKLSKAPKPMMETLCRLGICRLEIYDSKTVISTLQISAVLDYGKIYFRRICKGIMKVVDISW